MLGTLDRYIIKKFLGTFFFMIVLLLLVAVIFDLSEKTGDFAGTKASVHEIIFDYYVNFMIHYGNLLSGLFIFLAVLLFTSRLAQRSEVVAMLSSGVSFPRLMRPFFIGASILVLISLAVTHYFLPDANKVRLAFEEKYIRATFFVEDRNLHREIAPGEIAYCEHYGAKEKTLYTFGLEQWVGSDLVSKLHADRAVYDSVNGSWHVTDWTKRTIKGDHELIQRGHEFDTVIPLKPTDFGQRWETAMAMSTGELNDYIKAKEAQGDAKVTSYLIEKHQRTASPFAVYVFTLIGVGIASRKVRGGTGLHLAAGVGLGLTYVFAQKLTTVAATNAGLEPVIAVWIPNAVFALIGVWIYRSAPK